MTTENISPLSGSGEIEKGKIPEKKPSEKEKVQSSGYTYVKGGETPTVKKTTDIFKANTNKETSTSTEKEIKASKEKPKLSRTTAKSILVPKKTEAPSEKKNLEETTEIKELQKIKVSSFLCEVDTTYHPLDKKNDPGKEGILDFAHVFEKLGTAYVADGTGHGNIEKRKPLKKLWSNFNNEFVSRAKEIRESVKTVADFKNKLKEMVFDLNKQFEEVRTGSTFTFTMLVEINGKKYAAIVNIGDAALYHVKSNGELKKIEPDQKNKEMGLIPNPKLIKCEILEVESGDRFYGMTDGIADVLDEKKLEGFLKNPPKDKSIFTGLKQMIESQKGSWDLADKEYKEKSDLLEKSQGTEKKQKYAELKKALKQVYDPTNANSSDDISMFMLSVP